MKSILMSMIVMLYDLASSDYKMGPYITCLEQNDEVPYGFKESLTYANEEWCAINDAEMVEKTGYDREYWCQMYKEGIPEARFGERGDVCDHEDPETKQTRNACKGAFMFLPAIDAEKSWSWKCAEISGSACPFNHPGCLINTKRVMCCCQQDYCQSATVFAEYAAFARPDHYPIDFAALLAIDPGDLCVMVDSAVPGADDYPYSGACDQYDDYDTDTDTDTGTDDNDEDQVSIERCEIREAIPNECSCGGTCQSIEYEYRAVVVSKCGEQVLSTGLYGGETCNPNHVVYETGDIVSCKVLDCVNGEFDILSAAYTINTNWIWNVFAIIVFVMMKM